MAGKRNEPVTCDIVDMTPGEIYDVAITVRLHYFDYLTKCVDDKINCFIIEGKSLLEVFLAILIENFPFRQQSVGSELRRIRPPQLWCANPPLSYPGHIRFCARPHPNRLSLTLRTFVNPK